MPFFNITEEFVTVNREGELVLNHLQNVHDQLENNMIFGAVNKYDYYFNKKENKLIKTV